MKRLLHTAEDSLLAVALAVMAILPLAEIVARAAFGIGIPGSIPIVQHLTMWVAFLGAAVAAREQKLLALATGQLMPEGKTRDWASVFATAVSGAVSAALAFACWELVKLEKEWGSTFAEDWKVWVALLVLPASFTAVALRQVWNAGPSVVHRLVALVGPLFGFWLARKLTLDEFFLEDVPLWPMWASLALATVLGGPIFAAIGGAALLLFATAEFPTPPVAVPVETYRMAVSPHLPALPMFTLAGFLLGEGGAPKRLLHVFHALFGWMPGGTAVVCACLCAFLTVFTGGSGVTILVAGGILFTALQADGYKEQFSLGLLTASGSLGLLLPPALPLILYGIVAEQPIDKLFIGGILPGLLLIGLIAAWGVWQGVSGKVKRTPFSASAARSALWDAKFELFLPVFVLLVFFGGYASLMELAAVTALYAFCLQTFIHRDVTGRDLLRVFRECGVLIGGVLLIFGVSMGLTSYLVDAQVPMRLVAWATEYIESPIVFLLCLNIFLLGVGCVMDIFSATVVVVPLIVPLGVAFGIDPVHLGIIFIANLELGYLTPPVGLNLFLASYRFDKPLLQIYRAALPMLLILGVGVLLITYVPWLTTFLVGLGDAG